MKKKQICIIILSFFVIVILTNLAAAGNSSSKFGKLLLQLEKSIKSRYMSAQWRKKRVVWRNSIGRRNVTIGDIKKAIIYLDKFILMSAYKNSRQNTVQTWQIELSTARNIKAISNILIYLNNNLKTQARKSWWKNKKNKWITNLKNI